MIKHTFKKVLQNILFSKKFSFLIKLFSKKFIMKQNIIYLSSIMFILLISYIFSKNIFEQFINPSIKEEILLRKCFNENELNSFKKYYDYTNIINIKDSIIFSTPNKVIQEIPKITWNGIF